MAIFFRVNSQKTMLSWFFFLWQKSEAVIRDLEEMVGHESQYENPLDNLVMPLFEGQVVDAHALESIDDQLVWLTSNMCVVCIIGPEKPKRGTSNFKCARIYTATRLTDSHLANFQIWQPCLNVFLVSKETVILRQWERWKQKFGFNKRVDEGWIITVKSLESWRFER